MKTKQILLDATQLKFNDDQRTFEGYASVFNGVDSYGDSIEPGAYADTLKDRERPIRMRWNHFGPVIGKWLEIREDETGLYVKGQLTPGHSVADNVYASMKHGAVEGLSIGYMVEKSRREGDVTVLERIELFEISVVEEPADLGAQIAAVKASAKDVATLEDVRQVERFLMTAGLSKAVAVAVISRVKSLAMGDPVPEKKCEGEPAPQLNLRLLKALKISSKTRIAP